MLKIGLSRRPGNREIGDCYPSTPSRRLRVTKRSPAGGHRVDSNSADYFRMMPDGVCARRPTFLRRGDAATLPYAIDAQVISKTLIHLMERPPGRTSRHIERIIGAQKRLRLQDLLILATDTESLHPDIDTDIVLSTDFAEIHPWLVVWHGNEIPVLQYLHDHNYVCCRVGINRGGVAAMARRSTRANDTRLRLGAAATASRVAFASMA